ncbi:nicotinate (nicotinamide) nucleotide adenylyltransferase [Arcobacter sp. CECT 8985]|uniref:nicotinate (nicotinamide) nucleotide adenylyltransferase n=1 Tax=Arcobacter sp. CECT 8985 TaxID=1935424 RepID=UPI00100C12B0|nr:nicotinate (nicotinamide) nucleotide adenylyltransferase [Arcobacter sp. CECT 8985]RXJ85209.1 nicotinate (nicotinamide) nucleotide adenylyltransferase [Arcobacter sp. CECT 8985]
MRIAVFGGSFDPPHIAHEKIVNIALEQLDIDKIFIVPTYLNPFKDDFHLKPEKRFSLLTRLFKDNKKVIISDYEINQKRKVPSFETIQFLKHRYNISKIYFIIGTDNYSNLNKWYKYEELKNEVEFVIAKRIGFLNENLDKIKTLDVDIDISSTHLRNSINLEFISDKIKDDVKSLYKIKKGN